MALDEIEGPVASVPQELDSLGLMRLQFSDETLVDSHQLLLGLRVNVKDEVINICVEESMVTNEDLVVLLLTIRNTFLPLLLFFDGRFRCILQQNKIRSNIKIKSEI